MKNNYFTTNRHACFILKYHLVVVTKYRRKIINDKIKGQLISISHNIFEDRWGCHIIEINTDVDHIHILFEAPPQVQLSKLINNFKTVSSRLLRRDNEEIRNVFNKDIFWSRSYYIGALSDTTEEVVKNYIQLQGIKKRD